MCCFSIWRSPRLHPLHRNVGGTVYNQWNQGGGGAFPVDSQSNPLSFYWVTGGSYTVSYTAGGATASATFNVAAPTVVFVPEWDEGVPATGLLAGDLVAQDITVATVTPPGLYIGAITWLQVVTGAVWNYSGGISPFNQTCSPKGAAPWLDGSYPYPYATPSGISSTFEDQPTVNTTYWEGQGFGVATRQLAFVTYLLWQPTTSGASFPVPLEAQSWYVNDGATLISGTWTLNAGSVAGPIGVASPTSSYPTWYSIASLQCNATLAAPSSGQ